MYRKNHRRRRCSHDEPDSGSDKEKNKYYCINCGNEGHRPTECPSPVISCGIIVTRVIDNCLEFLLVRRRNSLSFIEFIRGKYDIYKEEYIKSLLLNMTQEEHRLLSSMNFKELWSYAWNTDIDNTPTSHVDEYIRSDEKFNRIVPKIQTFLKENKSNWIEPEWGFPKGRRNRGESDFVCAKREFYEETNLDENDYNIIREFPVFEETFIGSNGIPYTHYYYVAFLKKSRHDVHKDANTFMKSEIGDIKWMKYDEAILNIRPTNPEKRNVLTRIHKRVKEFLKL